jgi:hypothetical protein
VCTGALADDAASSPAQLLALERPCRTGGRRAAELLLAAASGRLSWEQVLIGAVCSAQLDPQPAAPQQQQAAPCSVVPCNGCHARRDAGCGQAAAASQPAPAGCWRCPAPDTARRDWLTHGEVQALYQTQLGAAQTLRYIDAHRAEVNQGVCPSQLALTLPSTLPHNTIRMDSKHQLGLWMTSWVQHPIWSVAAGRQLISSNTCVAPCVICAPSGTCFPNCVAVVRRALLGMGPAQDADLGAAQAALRDAADPLSRLCHPGPDGERAGQPSCSLPAGHLVQPLVLQLAGIRPIGYLVQPLVLHVAGIRQTTP